MTLISMILMAGSLLPSVARASILSDFFAAVSGTAEASSTGSAPEDTSNNSAGDSVSGTLTGNVQTMALLTPATNIDPSQSPSDAPTVADDSALVPADGPSGTTADVQQKTQNGVISVYVVKPGDTLSGIAALYGVPESTILYANDLTNKSVIQPGEVLTILPIAGFSYTVQQGDTLESIAKANGANAADIGSYNGVDDSTLTPGMQIIIPEGEAPAPTQSSSGSSSAPASTPKKKTTTSTSPQKVTTSDQILQGWSASGAVIPMANNPAEPARGVGPIGTPDQIAYYMSPLPVSSNHTQTQNIHGYNAVDIAAPTGTPIIAAADGEVIIAKTGGWNGGYGNYVVINHGNGSQTLYAHMSVVEATVGEEVAQGQVIGKVGETGDATGPHVHFEIRNGIRNPF